MARLWVTGLELMNMTLLLSHKKRGELEIKTLRYRNKWVSQRSSAAVCVSAWYSDSYLERETICYFLALQETKLPRSWTMSVRTTSPVNIKVDNESCRCGRTLKIDVKIKSAFNITKNEFDNLKMVSSRSM